MITKEEKEMLLQENALKKFLDESASLRGKPSISLAYNISDLYNGSRQNFIEEFQNKIEENKALDSAIWQISQNTINEPELENFEKQQLYVNLGTSSIIYRDDRDVIHSLQYMDRAGRQTIQYGVELGKKPECLISTHNMKLHVDDLKGASNAMTPGGLPAIKGNQLEKLSKSVLLNDFKNTITSDLKTSGHLILYGKEGRVYEIRG